MVRYRIYSFDGTNIKEGEEIEASSDHEAVAKVEQMRPKAVRCEVWEGRRFVASFNGAPETASA